MTAVGHSATKPARPERAGLDWRRAALPAATLLVIETLVALAVERLVASGLTWRELLKSYGSSNAWLGATFAPFGALVAYHRPRLSIGWLFCGFSLFYAASAFGIGVETYQFVHSHADHVGVGLGLLTDVWTPAIGVCFPLILLRFPDDRFASSVTRLLAIVAVADGVAWVVFWTLQDPAVVTLSADRERLVGHLQSATNIGILVLYVVSAVVLFILRSRATGRARSQLTWLVTGSSIAVALFSPTGWGSTGYLAHALLIGVPLFPIACTLAILRHRLFNLDIAVNRTLVFLSLSGGLLGIYLAVVAIARSLIGRGAQVGGGLVAAVLVAIVFAPARAFVQRQVDRLMFGSRHDPSRTMTTLAASLESSAQHELLSALRSVCQSLKIPHAVISLDDREVGSGDPDSDPVCLPLRFRDVQIGELRVWPRRGQRTLDAADLDVLRVVAGPLAAAAYSAQLSDQLHQSRLALIDSRAQERDRLHRDLHDGLGPALTAVALKADAAGNVVAVDQLRASTLLTQIAAEARGAITDVRRIAHGLRPPTLEHNGLLQSLRDEADRFTSRLDGSPLVVTTDLPSALPDVSDEVTSAVFHVSVEALTNVVRHSTASRAIVTIRVDDRICLEITDNGGTDGVSWVGGFGMASMKQRVAACGGSFRAEPGPAGGLVRVELPTQAGGGA